MRTGSGQVNSGAREMAHQAKKEGQVRFGDALLVKRQNEIAGEDMQIEVRVLDALGDSLAGKEPAEVVIREEGDQLLVANLRVDGHQNMFRSS